MTTNKRRSQRSLLVVHALGYTPVNLGTNTLDQFPGTRLALDILSYLISGFKVYFKLRNHHYSQQTLDICSPVRPFGGTVTAYMLLENDYCSIWVIRYILQYLSSQKAV